MRTEDSIGERNKYNQSYIEFREVVSVNEETKKREDFIKRLLVTLLEDQESVVMKKIKCAEDKTA